MFVLSCETHRLRGNKSADHPGTGRRSHAGVGGEDLEPVFDVVELSVCVSAQAGLIEICDCWQKRNEASYISRRKTNAARQYANRMDTS
jgi:hypothetical protein